MEIKKGENIFKCKTIMFMNLAVQEPSKLIKINWRVLNKETKEKVIERKKSTTKIDFFTLEDNFSMEDTKKQEFFLSQIDNEDISECGYQDYIMHIKDKETHNCKVFTENNCNYKHKFPKLEDLLNSNSKFSISGKEGVYEPEFIVTALSFDLRVRYYKSIQDCILVYFYSLSDAISFYKQYFNMLELSFIKYCDWSFKPDDNFLEDVSKKYIYKHLFMDKKIHKEVPVNEKDIEFSRKRFLERIEYYNLVKPEFSKTDIANMITDLEQHNTDFVFKNTKDLAVGSKSNKLMQEAIKLMSGSEIDTVIDNLGYEIVPISATKHGAYTVQTLLNYSTNRSHKKLICKYFAKEGEYLLSHEIGNYTFQKLMSFDMDMVGRFIISNFEDVIGTDLGIKVFKRCCEYLTKFKEDFARKLDEMQKEGNCHVQKYIQLKQMINNM